MARGKWPPATGCRGKSRAAWENTSTAFLPTKETRCRENSQAVRSEIRPRWRRRFAFRALTGSAKVAHSLHLLSFRYRSRGRDATAAIGFVGGTPPVYSRRHDLTLMSSYVPFSRERSFLSPALSLSLCLRPLVRLSPIYGDRREYAVQAIIHGRHGDYQR